MLRAIKIDIEGNVAETQIDEVRFNQLFGSQTYIERVRSYALREAFADDDGHPVLLVDEEGRVKNLFFNSKATTLYVPAAQRHHAWIAGDAYVITEAFTDDGYDFASLPLTIGVADIEDLIERNVNR